MKFSPDKKSFSWLALAIVAWSLDLSWPRMVQAASLATPAVSWRSWGNVLLLFLLGASAFLALIVAAWELSLLRRRPPKMTPAPPLPGPQSEQPSAVAATTALTNGSVDPAAISAGVIVQNSEGHITFANPAARELLGLDSGTDPDQSLKATSPVALSSIPSMATIKSGKPVHNLVLSITSGATKKMRWILLNAEPMRGSGEILSTFMDITDRKIVEETLLENERRYVELVEEAPDAILILDTKGDILSGNHAASQLLGYDQKEVLGKPLQTVGTLVPESIKLLTEELAAVLQGKGQEPIELTVVHGDQTRLTLEANARAVHRQSQISGVQMIIRDITARKRIEEGLHQRSEQLHQTNLLLKAQNAKAEALVLSIGDGVIATDEQGNVLIINQAAEKMAGWDAKYALGKHFTDVIRIEDEAGTALTLENRPLYQALKEGHKVITDNAHPFYIVNNTTKTRFPASITSNPVLIDDKIIGAIMVFRDMTKEREIDRAKSEFVSLASHQLRTPLSTINWYSEMLLAGDAGELTKDQRDYLDEIYEGNHRMVELVNALLNVSRIDLGTFAVNPEPTDITQVAETVIKELTPQIKTKEIALSKQFTSPLPKVPLDPKLMNIVILNLLSNAVKYTPAGGKVTLTIRQTAEEITMEVADTGYGIPEKDQGKIFTKLFRADNVKAKEAEGTGLGVYIAKSIVDQSGGKIWFKSAENKGTTFYVSLPLSGMKEREGTKELSAGPSQLASQGAPKNL